MELQTFLGFIIVLCLVMISLLAYLITKLFEHIQLLNSLNKVNNDIIANDNKIITVYEETIALYKDYCNCLKEAVGFEYDEEN